jgi:hypothetical protein
MRELEVRLALHRFLKQDFLREHPDSLIVDELGVLEGSFRVDLAVINSHLHGYEIKGPSDNLERLPLQQENYSRVFDRMTLVCAEKFIPEAVNIVPKNWGLISVCKKDGIAFLNEIWPSRQNYKVEPLAMIQLLWREEAYEVCREYGLHYNLRSKSRTKMWKVLSTQLSLDEIRSAIKRKLSTRTDWRSSNANYVQIAELYR